MQIFQTNNLTLIKPHWPAAKRVKAYSTTRLGGFSHDPFNSFNLALHVGDDPVAVSKNRELLIAELNLPSSPFWLDQRHTRDCWYFNSSNKANIPVADASWTDKSNLVSVVMTADCLPLLVTNKTGTLVSAIHAGWKGLLNGVVSQSIQMLPEKPENLMVWIGPAITQDAFEVGLYVFDAFVMKDPAFKSCFIESNNASQKYWADLPSLVKIILSQLGVTAIYGGNDCTFKNKDLFYSYRREGTTGRMASLIWLAD